MLMPIKLMTSFFSPLHLYKKPAVLFIPYNGNSLYRVFAGTLAVVLVI